MADYLLNGMWRPALPSGQPAPDTAPDVRRPAGAGVHVVARGTIDMKDQFVRSAMSDGVTTVVAHSPDNKYVYLLRSNSPVNIGAFPPSGRGELLAENNLAGNGLQIVVDYTDDGFGERPGS